SASLAYFIALMYTGSQPDHVSAKFIYLLVAIQAILAQYLLVRFLLLFRLVHCISSTAVDLSLWLSILRRIVLNLCIDFLYPSVRIDLYCIQIYSCRRGLCTVAFVFAPLLKWGKATPLAAVRNL